MQGRRAAVYIGGGALLVAWLAAANTSTRADPPASATAVAAPDRIDDVAVQVRAEGAQLHSRLTHAPAPTVKARNLFSFAPVAAPHAAPRSAAPAPEAASAPLPPPPLPLTLMGIAENPSPNGPVRTAILALQAHGDGGDGDIYMVTLGETIAARYSVTAIGVDAIELKDLTTGGFRRLALK